MVKKLIANFEVGKMGVQNIAIVFGPTVLRDPDPLGMDFEVISNHAKLVTILVNHYDEIFPYSETLIKNGGLNVPFETLQTNTQQKDTPPPKTLPSTPGTNPPRDTPPTTGNNTPKETPPQKISPNIPPRVHPTRPQSVIIQRGLPTPGQNNPPKETTPPKNLPQTPGNNPPGDTPPPPQNNPKETTPPKNLPSTSGNNPPGDTPPPPQKNPPEEKLSFSDINSLPQFLPPPPLNFIPIPDNLPPPDIPVGEQIPVETTQTQQPSTQTQQPSTQTQHPSTGENISTHDKAKLRRSETKKSKGKKSNDLGVPGKTGDKMKKRSVTVTTDKDKEKGYKKVLKNLTTNPTLEKVNNFKTLLEDQMFVTFLNTLDNKRVIQLLVVVSSVFSA